MRVRSIVSDIVLRSSGIDLTFTDGDSIIDGGLIDSISVLGLISSLESKFGITVHPLEFSIENFDSVDNISNFLFIKLNNRGNE